MPPEYVRTSRSASRVSPILIQHASDVAPGRTTALPEESRDHLEVLPPGHRRFDSGELTGETDGRPNGVRLPNDVASEDAHSPGVWFDEGRNASHECGLAGTVGTENGEDHSLLRKKL